jgi:hypothetical protein
MFNGNIGVNSRSQLSDLWLLNLNLFAENKNLQYAKNVFNLCQSIVSIDNDSQLIQFANKSSIEFKYINMLIENGCVIGKADSVKKTKLKQTIANIVIQKIQLFLNSFR